MPSTAYAEGQSSYFSLHGDYHNPYGPGTPGHDDFQRGWKQSLRQQPDLREDFEVLRARRRARILSGRARNREKYNAELDRLRSRYRQASRR